jgi:hypothetical protein
LQPWAYSQLNVVERILLSRRVAADRQPTLRHVRELFALLPPDLERFNFLFNTAVQGSVLETGDKLGLMDAKKNAEAASSSGIALRQRLGGLSRGGVSEKPSVAASEPAPSAPMAEEAYDAPQEDFAKELKSLEKAIAEPRPDLQRDGLDRASRFYRVDSNRRKSVRQLYRQLDKTQSSSKMPIWFRSMRSGETTRTTRLLTATPFDQSTLRKPREVSPR